MSAAPDLPSSRPVVVIGAGVAGLTAARTLHDSGLPVVVLDGADRVGGRIATDTVDGFRLDRGFQVLLTSYPEARRQLDLDALRLGTFEPGALVRIDGRFHAIADPVRRPARAFGTLQAPVGTVGDKLRLANLRRRLATVDPESLLERPGVPTRERLRSLGFSEQVVERFFRPFHGGVLLDASLETTSRMFEFTFAHFARGSAAIPAGGMAAIPEQLAAGLPAGAVRLGQRVVDLGAHHVTTDSGERIDAAAVVVATDASTARALLGEDLVEEPRWKGTTVVYFDAPASPLTRPMIALRTRPEDGPAAHLCVPSDIADGLAPDGRSLVSCTVLDGPGGRDAVQDRRIEDAVRDQCIDWFGNGAVDWRHLATVRIARALPDTPSGDAPVQRPASLDGATARFGGPIWMCGDHRDSASIQGAMQSGRRAAEAVLAGMEVAVG